jgi:hypothetical protein
MATARQFGFVWPKSPEIVAHVAMIKSNIPRGDILGEETSLPTPVIFLGYGTGANSFRLS